MYIWQLHQKKGREVSPDILGIVPLHRRMRRMSWLNYPKKKSYLLQASAGNISQTLAPEHRCRVSEIQTCTTVRPTATKSPISNTAPTCSGKTLNSRTAYAPGKHLAEHLLHLLQCGWRKASWAVLILTSQEPTARSNSIFPSSHPFLKLYQAQEEGWPQQGAPYAVAALLLPTGTEVAQQWHAQPAPVQRRLQWWAAHNVQKHTDQERPSQTAQTLGEIRVPSWSGEKRCNLQLSQLFPSPWSFRTAAQRRHVPFAFAMSMLWGWAWTELKTTAGVTERPEKFHTRMEKWSKRWFLKRCSESVAKRELWGLRKGCSQKADLCRDPMHSALPILDWRCSTTVRFKIIRHFTFESQQPQQNQHTH